MKQQKMMATILFLDFDGVLHPQYVDMATPNDEVFCHLPLFESVMREFPLVQIVISSTWRYNFSLEKLCTRFSPDIADRIIGVTPELEWDTSKSDQREREILAWLAENENSEWVALDDAANQFQQHRDRLVDCIWYIGFDEKVATKLRNALLADH